LVAGQSALVLLEAEVANALDVALNGLVKWSHEHTVCMANTYDVDGDNDTTLHVLVTAVFMLGQLLY
jgi:hypothetical protein